MSFDTTDEEMKLAIELSRKTFEEEEQRRTAPQTDLIQFESPHDIQQREKIDEIKRILTAGNADHNRTLPQPIGWRQDVSNLFGPSSSTYYPPIGLSQSFTCGPSYFSTTSVFPPPPLPPKSKNRPQGGTQTPDRYIPPFTLPPPLPPRLARQSTIETLHPPPRPPPPARIEQVVTVAPVIPTIYPAITLEQGQYKPSYNSAQYEVLNADVYVPYTMLSKRLLNGDLIDLGRTSPTEDCSHATLDQIRREFDPLFRWTPEKETPIMPSIGTAAGLDRSKDPAETPAITAVPSPYRGEDKENQAAHRWMSLESIKLRPNTPPTLKQIAVVKERGIKHLTNSSLHFKASTADYMTTSAPSVKVVISTDHSWSSENQKTISVTCDTKTTVDMIITEVLADILPERELANGLHVDSYGLKVYGLDEYLPHGSQFGHNLYVGNCLLHGKDVKLEIGRIDNVEPRSSSPAPTWDKMKSHIKYSSVLDKEDIENLKVHLTQEMNNYEEAFLSTSTLKISSAANKVKQCVKMLCKLLNSIEPVNLHQHLNNYLMATTNDQLRCSKNDFIASLHNFIAVYCSSTMSMYKLDALRPLSSDRKEILHCKENLKVMVNSIHNLPEDWVRDYAEFYMTVNVYYGTRLIDGHDKCISKTVKHDAFFPYVPMSLYVGFNHKLCLCPRETKIMLILHGVVPQQPGGPDTTETKKSLAFASIPLFDHEMAMRQGQLFVPLTVLKDPVLKPWGPHPLIANEKDPIVIVTLPSYDHEVVFPDVAVEFQSAKQDLSTLDVETQQYLMDLIESGDTQKLSADEQEMLWQKRSYLMNHPEALPLVLASVSDWGYAFLSNVYQILEDWIPLSPVQAMQLLLPQYPDVRIRQKALEWIMRASSDFLFNALPQLVEALRFEPFESSSLAVALLTLSYKDRRFAFEIYWQLQQRIDHCVDFAYAQRCSLLQKELLERHEADHLRNEIARQHRLLNDLDCLQMDLRREESDANRLTLLRSRLGVMDSHLLQQNVRLPILPSFKCSGVMVRDCNIFNSNAKPLKIVFRGINSTSAIIHKSGDDMRQDALVLQMVGLMNDIWLSESLDLRIVLFRCMPVGYKKGMGELVSNCATLCDIQKESGMTGVFKDDILTNWIQKHNSSEFSHKMALDNFTRSCAGWCVATYVLGIGDRHNDNILVTTAGHVFHIDFGKYMGDWQTAGGFKRDRVPFVFTGEMYHVINGGNEQRESYQTFIDYCCRAFNYVRRKYSVLTNILKIMACSDIAGVNIESLKFVETNLMLELSETDAVIQFTQLINESLKSAFPRINFFIHTLAQMMTGNSARRNDHVLSFVPQLYTQATDGKIIGIRVISFEKRFLPNKVYVYKMEVSRETETVNTIVYRTFAEFDELYVKIRRRFPTIMFPVLSNGTRMRSNVREVAQRRMIEFEMFLKHLFSLPYEVQHCDLVYTFFHLILRDSNIDAYTNNDDMAPESGRSHCQVYLKIQYNSVRRQLSVFIGHVKHLAMLSSGQAPDSYVKTYVRPDVQNLSKRKTQVVKASQNPTFNKELSYDVASVDGDRLLATTVLEVSVWNSGGLLDNHRMYMVYMPLLKLKNQPEDRKGNRVLEGWYQCDKNI